MTKNAINGNAINEVSFPGAEAGLSLVELLGTAEVACSIPSVSLRLTAFATTAPEADGSASTTKRTQLDCLVGAFAACAATAQTLRPVQATTAAICSATAQNRLAYRLNAAAAGSAAAAVTGFCFAARGASTAPVATTYTAGARTLVPRLAATTGVAGTVVEALRKVPSTATGQAQAIGIGSITFRNRLAATATATAVNAATTRFNLRASASAGPSAVGAVTARRNLAMSLPPQTALAIAYGIEPQMLISLGAFTQANALTDATIRMNYNLSGSVVARAIAQSAASDFASAVPAPSERLMKVPASNRRMEVTE